MFKNAVYLILSLADDRYRRPEELYEGTWRPIAWRLGVLCLLALLIFCMPSLIAVALDAPVSFGGSAWLDGPKVTSSIDAVSWSGVAYGWMHPTYSAYQPLANTIECLQCIVSQWAWSREFPAFSAALHLGNALLLWFILRRLGVTGAWLCAAVFLVHPICMTGGIWIAQQGVVLSVFLCLLSILLFLVYRGIDVPFDIHPDEIMDLDPGPVELPCRGILWLAAAAGMLVLAALTGPEAVIVPPVLLALIWWQRKSVSRAEWRRLIPFFVIGVLRLGVTVWALLAGRHRLPDTSWPSASPFALATWTLWRMVLGTLFPIGMAPAGQPWGAVSGEAWCVALFVATALVSAWVWRKTLGSVPAVLASLAVGIIGVWCLLTPAGSTQFVFTAVPILYPVLALVLPGMVVALMTAIFWTEGRARTLLPGSDLPAGIRRALRLVCGCLLVVFLAGAAVLKSRAFVSESAFWRDSLARDPGLVFARVRLADMALDEDMPDADDADDALRAIPPEQAELPQVNLAMGRVYEARKLYNSAIHYFERAHVQQPDSIAAVSDLGGALCARNGEGDVARAAELYSALLARHPDSAVLECGLGQTCVLQNQVQEADHHFVKALQLDERYIPARLDLAKMLFPAIRQKVADGLQGAALDRYAYPMWDQLHHVVEIEPRNYDAFRLAGIIEWELSKVAPAKEKPTYLHECEMLMRDAVIVRSRSAEARDLLGIVLAAEGKFDEAMFHFSAALKLDPGFAEARQHLELAAAKKASGQLPKP